MRRKVEVEERRERGLDGVGEKEEEEGFLEVEDGEEVKHFWV